MAKYEFLTRIYTQIFNDEGDQGQQDQGQQQQQDQQQKTEPKKLEMTQEEFDQKLKNRLDRGKKSWEKEFHESDEYKAFKEFQDGQKTELEKLQGQLEGMDALKNERDQFAAEIQGYKQKESLTKADVNPEYTDFVMFEVKKGMSDDVDFNTALENFKAVESNAKYFGSQQQQQQFRQGQRHGSGQGSKGSTASSIISQMYGDK